jgi:hypothetical protein
MTMVMGVTMVHGTGSARLAKHHLEARRRGHRHEAGGHERAQREQHEQ